MRLDPRSLVSKPFTKCPNCGAIKGFGLLNVWGHEHFKRCKECLHQERYKLPSLARKIIYLDQFVVSDMMKALNPKTVAYKEGRVDGFWKELFLKLDRLFKLQLIICPKSVLHYTESMLSPYDTDLKQMYEYFSNDVSFSGYITIQLYQLHRNVELWLSPDSCEEKEVDIGSITRGDLTSWTGKFNISAVMNFDVDLSNSIRADRKESQEGMAERFKKWKTCGLKTFEEFFDMENGGYGSALLRVYENYLTINWLENHLFANGITKSEVNNKLKEYLQSDCIRRVPVNVISSSLLAALAVQSVSGRKKPPNEGLISDFLIISALYPYCDAMFLDRECHGLIREIPRNKLENYDTEIFSKSNSEEFLQYLDDIEKNAPASHIDKVFEIYGEDCCEPFTEMYEDGNEE